MAFRRTTDGTEEDLPNYIRRALGRDRSWMEQALCRTHELRKAHAWTVSVEDTVQVGDRAVPGARLIDAALIVCKVCPQQWHCARWAVDVDERAGTWAMPSKDLMWLKKESGAEGIIHLARIAKTPVQVAVREARFGPAVASPSCSPSTTQKSPGSNRGSSRILSTPASRSTDRQRRSGLSLIAGSSTKSIGSPTRRTKKVNLTSSPASPSTSSTKSESSKKTPLSTSA